MTVNFSEPVQSLAFSLMDVDANTPSEAGADRQEVVQITGHNSISNTTVNPTLVGGSANSVSSNVITGISEAANTAVTGNVSVSFAGYVTSVSITFSVQNIVGTPSGNAEPGFGIGNMTYCVAELPLPVRLARFSGTAENGIAQLQWKTATEENASGFQIQTSKDAKNFRTVAFVPAKGNFGSESNYEWSQAMNSPTEYFRLRMIDQDSTYTYSRVISVKHNFLESLVSFGPNPFDTYLKLNGTTSDPFNLELYDISGRRQKSFVVEDGSILLNTSDLKSGLYVLRISDMDGKMLFTKTLLKNLVMK